MLLKLCEYKQAEMVEAKACADHIYMCLSIPPKYSVAQIVGYINGKSAIQVFERYSRLRYNFGEHKFRGAGDYVSTVGLDEARICKYIQGQEENDRLEDS
jgi:putative transposase